MGEVIKCLRNIFFGMHLGVFVVDLFCFKQIRVLIKYFYCLIFSSFLFLFFFFPPLLGKKLQYLFEPYFRIESYTFALWDTRG